jgi:tetratricopeptide (TPR) repeat protein
MILAAFLSRICYTGNISQHRTRCAAAVIIVLMLASAESFATRRYLADWKDTDSLFAHMIRITPRATPLWNVLGEAYGKKNETEKAMEYFNEAMKIDPNDIYTLVNRGMIFAIKGKYDEAESCYRKAIELYPDAINAYRNLGGLLIKEGRTDEAIAIFRKGLAEKPRNAWILHSCLGKLFINQRKIDLAVYEYQTAVKMMPNLYTYNNLGGALALKGRPDEALYYFRKAGAHCNIANILY